MSSPGYLGRILFMFLSFDPVFFLRVFRSLNLSPGLGRHWWVSELIPRFTKIFEYSKNFEVIVFSIKNSAFTRNLSPLARTRAEKSHQTFSKWPLREFFGRKSTFFSSYISKDSPFSCDHFDGKVLVKG